MKTFALASAFAAPVASTLSGTYTGSVPFILDMTITFPGDGTMDFDQNVKIASTRVQCPTEKISETDTQVIFPETGAEGDCMGDALRSQSKDPSLFTIDINSDGTLTFKSDGWPDLKLKKASALQDKPEVMPWADWKQEFGWQTNDAAEDAKREGIYHQNVAFITAENAKGHSYRLGVNKFSHLTEEEFVAQFTGKRVEDQDIPNMGELPTLDTIADSVDWRTQGVVNPVKDQGQCGSCWAFSAAGTVESAYAVTNGKLFSIAEQQLVDCAHEGGSQGCNGGWEDQAITHYATHGACTESGYTYTATTGTCQESGCETAFGPGAVTGSQCTALSADGILSALQTQPVAVAVYVDSTFQAYRSGIVDSQRCHQNVNHAVIAVAYDADSFTIRNSWGANWGESGYIRLARNTVSTQTGPFCLWSHCPAVPTMAVETVV
jgi:hypothetical protein